MTAHSLDLDLLPGECWWGGAVADGQAMPFGGAPHRRDLARDLTMNQGMPLLLSSRGRSVWSDGPFAFAFAGGTLRIEEAERPPILGEGWGNLRAAFRQLSRSYFPPAGSLPDPALFAAPQYNTWIEMLYEPTQGGALAYAEAILANDFPPGVLMIDAGWQEDYGAWTFHPGRFPEPRALIDRLHEMGFKVMLWVVPYVSPDSATFRWLERQGFLLRDRDEATAIRRWWDGHSAVFDCTNEATVAWFHAQLDHLVAAFDVDGFKFDGGDPVYYLPGDLGLRAVSPAGYCAAWAAVGLRYPLSEYRACWKGAGWPLAQRLRDKAPAWDGNGLAALIPDGLAQGLMGYAFTCPDMIGGGEYLDFLRPDYRHDAELFVRSAQCAALFPMMQFSTAPWRVLDREHLSYCRDAAHLHVRLAPEILELAGHAARDGEPIMRHLTYVFPDHGYERVSDQFLLGDDILVAPVVARGATRRRVIFPQGTWRGDDGGAVVGPCAQEIAAPLSRLPWFRRIEG